MIGFKSRKRKSGTIPLSQERILIVCCMVFSMHMGIAQQVRVSGVIRDANTKEAISYAIVGFMGSSIGGCTNQEGCFSLQNNYGLTTLRISSVGYETKVIEIDTGYVAEIEILLQASEIMLEAVTISAKKGKYTKKDNPAVDFMKEAIARKHDHRMETKSYYRTEQYEKFTTSLDNFNDDGKIFKKFGFLKNYLDTSEINGKPILNLSVKETFTDVYYRKTPRTKKDILKAKREEGIGKDLDESVTHNIQDLFQGINLYDNDIKLLQYFFVSPLSSTLAVSFYKYFISDTIIINDIPCLKLSFYPFNPQSQGFTGSLCITLDGHYALVKAELQVPSKINLNFAKNLSVTQTFTCLEDSTWVLSEENLYVNLYLFKGLPDVLIHQLRSYRNYNFDEWNHSVFDVSANKLIKDESLNKKSDEFWEMNRPVPIRQKETGVKKMMAQLREIPLYKTIVKASDFFASGYFLTGGNREKSMFDIGPLMSIISFNKIEGCHIKLGGMTTANLSKHLFLSGYVAYGTRDKKFKYNGKITYSFNKKEYHENEFPRDNVSFLYEYDLYALGSDYQGYKDDILMSWRVGNPVTKMSYIQRVVLSYEKDWDHRFNSKIWIKGQVDKPTGTLVYRMNSGDPASDISSLTTSEVGIRLRYVIGAKPYNGRNPAMNLSKNATEFILSHYMGFKGFLGGEYNYQRTEFSFRKRVNLSAFGYFDAKLTAGKVWTKVPFPLLILPNANQSITIQPDAFHMMRSLEFVVDQYLDLNVTYHLNGLLFNRIPYVNFLKLREVISFHGVLGSLTKKNNSDKTSELYLLPEGTAPLGSTPYMEISVGIENIFKVLRVDYFHRLSYGKGAKSRGGVRFTLGVTF